MNIIIVAGGLGTRFGKLSCFPKILLPTDRYDSILQEDLNLFNNITLIINEKFYDMVNNYCLVNNLNIKIVSTNNCNGSYNTILSVYDEIPHDDVLFVWSDLIIRENVPLFENDTIITYNGNYRYVYDDKSRKAILSSNYDGNVPGIYYIKDLNKYFNIELDSKDNLDLVDVLYDIDNYNINNLIEYRDIDTYKNIIKNNDIDTKLKTRFFNKITKDNGILYKEAIDKNYYKVINDEFNWYKTLNNNLICPKIYDNFYNGEYVTKFSMEFLEGYISLHKYIKKSGLDEIKVIYENIQKNFDILHKNSIDVDIDTFKSDLKKEIIDKVIARCDKISHMLINYDKQEMIDYLQKSYDALLKLYDGKYYFCHGDLNGSNVMVNPTTKQVKFIDPRGYFGNTKLFGWKPYEYAKLLYCLNGYDDFNNLPQIYTIDEPIRLNCYGEIDYLNKDEYKILVGVIYIALAGYISQDIMKANISYEYGMKLLKNIFDN